MARRIKIDGTEFESSLDNGEFPEKLMEIIEEELSALKDDPGGVNSEIVLVLGNDFEPEDEEEDEESNDEETETEGKEVK